MTLYGKREWLMAATLFVLLVALCTNSSMAQSMGPQSHDSEDKAPLQSGYAVITPTSVATAGLVVFETFGQRHGNEMTQAGVLPAAMATTSMLFVSTDGRLSKNLGVAIANPASSTAHINVALRDDSGGGVGTPLSFSVDAHMQTARFVTDMFSGQPNVPRDFTGTILISSDIPVAVVGLRFRGQNFSTLPATSLSALTTVPVISSGVGGPAAVILPQFATGGGWATEIVIANSGSTELVVRVDLFAQNGGPLTATLNGQSKSTFDDVHVPAGGVVVLAPRVNGDDDEF